MTPPPVEKSRRGRIAPSTPAAGTVAAGGIGLPFCGGSRPSTSSSLTPTGTACRRRVEADLGVTHYASAVTMVPHCDAATINARLHPETEGLFDGVLNRHHEGGSYIVNAARTTICDRDAIVRALKSGRLGGGCPADWHRGKTKSACARRGTLEIGV